MSKRGRRAKNKARRLRNDAVAQQPVRKTGRTPGVPGGGGAQIVLPEKVHEVLPVSLFELGACTVWAGDFKARDGEWCAIVSLGETDKFMREDFRTMNGAEAMFPRAAQRALRSMGTPELHVDWDDYGSPPKHVTARFWIDLLQDLGALSGDVLVHCMGGHGRTGTAVAAMAHLAPVAGFAQVVPKGDCVVKWARAKYSVGAVESEEQGDYLKDLGAYVSPESFKSLGVRAAAWGGGNGYHYCGEGTAAAAAYHGATSASAWWHEAVPEKKGSAHSSADATSKAKEAWAKFCDMCGVEITGAPVTVHMAGGGVFNYCTTDCLNQDRTDYLKDREEVASPMKVATVKFCDMCGVEITGALVTVRRNPPLDYEYCSSNCMEHDADLRAAPALEVGI